MSAESFNVSRLLSDHFAAYRTPAFDLTVGLVGRHQPWSVNPDVGVGGDALPLQDFYLLLRHKLDYLSDDQNHNREVMAGAFNKLRDRGYWVVAHNLKRYNIGTHHVITLERLEHDISIQLAYFEPSINVVPYRDYKSRIEMQNDRVRKRVDPALFKVRYPALEPNAEGYDFSIDYNAQRVMQVTFEAKPAGHIYQGAQAPYLDVPKYLAGLDLAWLTQHYTVVDEMLRYHGFTMTRIGELETVSRQVLQLVFERGSAVVHVDFRH